jgi:hypothetical protein
LETRPVINPNFTCFDDSIDISYKIANQLLLLQIQIWGSSNTATLEIR